MKNKLYAIALLLSISFVTIQCKHPLDKIQIDIDGSNIIKYSAVFEVAEARGASVSGLNVTIGGADADFIYDLGGTKNFAINSGMLSLGVDPHFNPTSSKPVRFDVILSGQGFITEIIPVTIVQDQLQQLKQVAVMRELTPPPSASAINATFPLTLNAVIPAVTFNTPLSNGVTETVTVNLTEGTQFKSSSSDLIKGPSLSASVMNFNMADPKALDFFPGGSLISDRVIGPENKEVAATFLPAAFTSIDMRVAGTQVKSFNQPVNVSMGINPSYQNERTGQTVKAGDMLSVYSYESSTGVWKYEKEAAVINVNGKLQLPFTTNHLTWFMTGIVFTVPRPAVTPKIEITFLAPWLNGADLPVTIKIKQSGMVVRKQQHALKHNAKWICNGILEGSYTLEIWGNDQMLLYTGTIVVPAGNNMKVTFEIVSPAVVGPLVSMELKIKCPNKSTLITPPDFYLYYNEVNVTGSFRLLGLVSGGTFTTRLLDLNKRYNFKAVWGDKTKIVLDRKVSTDNLLIANQKNAGKGGCGCAQAQVTMFIGECAGL